MYDQEIWDELKVQYELSLALREGVLGWAKVCDGSGHQAQIYLPTTLELLNKAVAYIDNSPERMRRTIEKFEEMDDSKEQKTVVDSLKQYYEKLAFFEDEALKLVKVGEQAKRGEESKYLGQITQKMYEMAESMDVASTNLKTVLMRMQDLEVN